MRFDSSQQETFATAFHSLLSYVNRRYGIVRDDVDATSTNRSMQSELVSRFLWDHCDLIDDFVHENPDNLPPACLKSAADLVGTLYGTFFLVNHSVSEATVLHHTGIYRLVAPSEAYFMTLPDEPVEMRGAIAPCGDLIVPIPPLSVMGRVSESLLAELRSNLAAHNADRPTGDASVLSIRARAWQRMRRREREAQASDGHTVKGPGKGFHRGKLAGLSEEERLKQQAEHLRRIARSKSWEHMALEPLLLHAQTCPESLSEGLSLLDDEWIFDIATALDDQAIADSHSRSKLVQRICATISDGEAIRDYALMTCTDDQLDLIRLLARKGQIPLDAIDPLIVNHLDPLVPMIFLIETDDDEVVAWMAPEVQRIVREADFPSLTNLRERLDEVRYAARALATMCGVISVDDAYKRYRDVARQPFAQLQFETALGELEECGARDDYALWRHKGRNYLVSAEISDTSAAARVSQESYADHIVMGGSSSHLPCDPLTVAITEDDEGEFIRLVMQKEVELEQIRLALLHDDRDLPPHALPPFMLEPSPIRALAKLDALRALHAFVDQHIPNDQNDYEFADVFVRSIIVSCVLMGESYNETMDIIRLYRMEHCEGTNYSDTLGRLVTNAYNALPRWELNGWSLEENTERITGRRRFFNEDGTVKAVSDDDPCPCGSGKSYGMCCGNTDGAGHTSQGAA